LSWEVVLSSAVVAAVVASLIGVIRDRLTARTRLFELLLERAVQPDIADAREKLARVISYLQHPEEATDWTNEWRGADQMISQARGLGLPTELVELMRSLQGLVEQWRLRVEGIAALSANAQERRRQLLDDERLESLVRWVTQHGGDIRAAYQEIALRIRSGRSVCRCLWWGGHRVLSELAGLRSELDAMLARSAGARPGALTEVSAPRPDERRHANGRNPGPSS